MSTGTWNKRSKKLFKDRSNHRFFVDVFYWPSSCPLICYLSHLENHYITWMPDIPRGWSSDQYHSSFLFRSYKSYYLPPVPPSCGCFFLVYNVMQSQVAGQWVQIPTDWVLTVKGYSLILLSTTILHFNK